MARTTSLYQQHHLMKANDMKMHSTIHQRRQLKGTGETEDKTNKMGQTKRLGNTREGRTDEKVQN